MEEVAKYGGPMLVKSVGLVEIGLLDALQDDAFEGFSLKHSAVTWKQVAFWMRQFVEEQLKVQS